MLPETLNGEPANACCSVAKDRSWFGEDYKAIDSLVLRAGNSLPVRGIGSVELKVHRLPNASGPDAHSIILLRNVLHVPDSVCNILGLPFVMDHNISFAPPAAGTRGTVKDRQNRSVAYFRPDSKLLQVKLSEPPVGPITGAPPFELSDSHWNNMSWPAAERSKWEIPPAIHTEDHDVRAAPVVAPRLSTRERRFLKRHFRDEFKFLTQHELSIFDEGDREEGRRILRALMARGDGRKNVAPGRKLASSYFSRRELAFISVRYNDPISFMRSQGLSYARRDDGMQAKTIVRGMMDDLEQEDRAPAADVAHSILVDVARNWRTRRRRAQRQRSLRRRLRV